MMSKVKYKVSLEVEIDNEEDGWSPSENDIKISIKDALDTELSDCDFLFITVEKFEELEE
jgi:hypothetical protein